MTKANAPDEELVSRLEAALRASHRTLEAIAKVKETQALDDAILRDVLKVEDEIKGHSIFPVEQHHAINDLAKRLEPIIMGATTVHYISDDSWDINPPMDQTIVDPYGIATIDLRDRLLGLASRLAAIETLIKAKDIAADLLGNPK